MTRARDIAGGTIFTSADNTKLDDIAMGVLPDIRPSLLLDFANSKTLDPRITFTRGSTATYWDGKTTAKAEENLLNYSQDLSNAAWIETGVTVTANNTAAPDGTTTAEKVAISTEGASRQIRQAASGLVSTAYTASVYVKKSNWDYVRIELSSRTSNNVYIATNALGGINLTNGASVGSDTGTITRTSVGNGWYRITASGTSSSNAGMAEIKVIFTDSSGVPAPSTNIANGSAIFVWGAQLEQRSSATAYTPTTTAPVVKYQPALQTEASGAARFDHDPVTGESKGLLIEEARTNLLPYSADFSNSAWVKTKAAVYSNQVIAPDGTQTASNVVGTTVSGEHYIQDFLTAATGTFTDSVFVKANGVTNFFIRPVHEGADEGATQTANFNLSNGTIGSLPSNTTATITDVGNDWYRCTFTFTMTGTLSGSYGVRLQLSVTGDGYKGVYLWGAQREAGSFPTSYIPTSGSTVTRAADAAAITGSNFTDWFRPDSFTFYREVEKGWDLLASPRESASTIIRSADYSSSVSLRFVTDTSGPDADVFVKSLGVTYVDSNDNPDISSLNIIRQAVSLDHQSALTTATGDTSVGESTSIVLGVNFSQMNVDFAPDRQWFRKIAFYPKKLASAQLTAMMEE